jgi:hypothetical protein
LRSTTPVNPGGPSPPGETSSAGSNGPPGWFATIDNTRSITITSHNGSAAKRRDEGRLDAFRRAYDQGYRRFQVDVLPISGELVSMHSTFGRNWRLGRMNIDAFRTKYPGVPTLTELLQDPKLGPCHWNIEAKSIKALDGLRSALTPSTPPVTTPVLEPHKILLSTPFRPRLAKTIAKEFPNVSVAAPILHGGAVGVRFLGARRSMLPGNRPYDCEQIWYPLLRTTPENRPFRQGWTIGRFKSIDRMADAKAHAIVNSERLVVRGTSRQRPPRIHQGTRLNKLALGGGGWRGAFGGIGTVMYLNETNKWDGIDDVVGISGGSFTVAALSQERQGVSVDQTLKDLLTKMETAARRVRTFVSAAALLAVAAVAAWLLFVDTNPFSWAPAWLLIFAPVALSVIGRVVVHFRWRAILLEIFDKKRLPVNDPNANRRYAIGATGLHDGELYAFTTDFHGDAERWRAGRNVVREKRLAVPLGDASLARAVGRATSLPGLGQLGFTKLWWPEAPDHAPDAPCHKCRSVADRLVDGGISGIFGRGLLRSGANPASSEQPNVLVMDAGRRLVANGGTSGKHQFARILERLSVVMLLARWLAVAIDVGYRSELDKVGDGSVNDGNMYFLVRLAEPESTITNPGMLSAEECTRADHFERLYTLRDRVHKFSLMGANRTNADRTIVAAVVACALEFEVNPSIEELLSSIGDKLGRGTSLVDTWRKLPLL